MPFQGHAIHLKSEQHCWGSHPDAMTVPSRQTSFGNNGQKFGVRSRSGSEFSLGLGWICSLRLRWGFSMGFGSPQGSPDWVLPGPMLLEIGDEKQAVEKADEHLPVSVPAGRPGSQTSAGMRLSADDRGAARAVPGGGPTGE